MLKLAKKQFFFVLILLLLALFTGTVYSASTVSCSSVLQCLSIVDSKAYGLLFEKNFEPASISPNIVEPIATADADKEPKQGEGPLPDTEAAFENFSFAVVSDTHIGRKLSGGKVYPEEWLEKAVSSINAQKMPLAFFLGDLTNAGTKEQFDELFSIIDKLNPNVVFVPLIGNHDGSLSSKKALFAKYSLAGKSGITNFKGEFPIYYSFDYKGSHFVMLSITTKNISSSASLAAALKSWFEKDLQGAKGKYNHVLVFSHFPLKNAGTTGVDIELSASERSWFVERLKQVNAIWFSGHRHVYYKGNVLGIPQVAVATNVKGLIDKLHMLAGTIRQSNSYVTVDVLKENLNIKALDGSTDFASIMKEPSSQISGFDSFNYQPETLLAQSTMPKAG